MLPDEEPTCYAECKDAHDHHRDERKVSLQFRRNVAAGRLDATTFYNFPIGAFAHHAYPEGAFRERRLRVELEESVASW